MVEEGEEGETEERGQREGKGIGLFRHIHKSQPDCSSKHIDEPADAKNRDGQDAAEGHDALPPFALLLFHANASHSGVCEVRRQAWPLSCCEGLAKGSAFNVLFHVSSVNKVCDGCGAGVWQWCLAPRRECKRCQPKDGFRSRIVRGATARLA